MIASTYPLDLWVVDRCCMVGRGLSAWSRMYWVIGSMSVEEKGNFEAKSALLVECPDVEGREGDDDVEVGLIAHF